MANFIGMVFATLKDNGINTSGMSTDEAVKKYNELKNKDLTPAEKDRLDNMDKEGSKNNADEIAKLKDELAHTSMFAPGNKRQELKDRIGMLEGGYSSMQEYKKAQEEKEMQRLREVEKKRYQQEQRTRDVNTASKKEGNHTTVTKEKEKQFEIIQKTNPMRDDYHVGIRSPEDIKTWDEAIEDEESFAWGDFTKEDAKKAKEKGVITIYSSYPIKQGVFVSTSKQQALEYAGSAGREIYTKTIPLGNVAWINGDEGQYAEI